MLGCLRLCVFILSIMFLPFWYLQITFLGYVNLASVWPDYCCMYRVAAAIFPLTINKRTDEEWFLEWCVMLSSDTCFQCFLGSPAGKVCSESQLAASRYNPLIYVMIDNWPILGSTIGHDTFNTRPGHFLNTDDCIACQRYMADIYWFSQRRL